VNIIYQELFDRIHGAIPDLDRVVKRTLRAWPCTTETSEDQDVYYDYESHAGQDEQVNLGLAESMVTTARGADGFC